MSDDVIQIGEGSVTPAHVVDDDDEVKGYAAIFPGGPVVVKWKRRYFPEDDRTEFRVTSQYATVSDAEQGTSGTIVEVDA